MRTSWGWGPLPRAEGVSGRAVSLAMAARFADELAGGLPDVLLPTIRARLGFGYAQVGLLSLALNTVAAVIEPISGLLIDAWSRRWLLAWGALTIGAAVIVIGLAPTFAVLLAGFALYGLGSGPLAHTADVVLVEAHPAAPDRAFARATVLDTIGAIGAPLSVAFAFGVDVDERWLLLGGGALSVAYGVLLARTAFPAPGGGANGAARGRAWADARDGVRAVLASPRAVGWLAFLLAHDLLEAPLVLETVWLADVVGLGQAQVGLFRAMELAVSLAGVVWLERRLGRTAGRRILLLVIPALLCIYPAWLLTPGVWPRVVLAVPLNLLGAALWPIGRAQSLVSVRGRAGAVTAVHSLTGLLPLGFAAGLLAEQIGPTRAILALTMPALVLLFALASRRSLWAADA